MAPDRSIRGYFCAHTRICRRSSVASAHVGKGSRVEIEPLHRLNPGRVRWLRRTDLTSVGGGGLSSRRETDSAATVCEMDLSSPIGRRIVPPRTAVPSGMSEEPWRERPPIARRAAVPRAFGGSFTPRFPVSGWRSLSGACARFARTISSTEMGSRRHRRTPPCAQSVSRPTARRDRAAVP